MEYKNAGGEMTYTGLLLYCEISSFDLQELHRLVLMGEGEAVECARELDFFRMYLEKKMEQALIYQRERCDYKALQFMYAESKAGGVWRKKVIVPSGNIKSNSGLKLGSNVSGVKIATTNNS